MPEAITENFHFKDLQHTSLHNQTYDKIKKKNGFI